MTRLLLVSDAGYSVDALNQSLDSHPRLDVERLHDSAAAIRALKDAPFDLVLVDASMPESLDVVAGIAECGTETRVAALGARPEDALAWARAGASGYVSRQAPLEEIPERVRALIRGELDCPSAVVAELFRTVARLGKTCDVRPVTSNRFDGIGSED